MAERWSLLIVVSLFVAACGEATVPPPPGARGPVDIQIWQQPGAVPARVHAAGIEALDDEGRRLALAEVAVAWPQESGVLKLASPRGVYDREAGQGVLEGPVALDGMLDGDVVSGTAASVRILDGMRMLELHDVDMHWSGSRCRAQVLRVTERRRFQAEEWRQTPAP